MTVSCSVDQAWEWLQDDSVVMVDVRAIEERLASGVPPKTVAMHWSSFRDRLPKLMSQYKKILLMCSIGQESLMFCQTLASSQQNCVTSVTGGFDAWFLADLPIEACHVSDEIQRYDRQMRLPGVGRQGQEKLSNSHVLMVGVGGLGVPVLQYLTSAGVGKIAVVDDDVVSLSNLPRQVIYQAGHLGQDKVKAAAEWVALHNPGVEIHALNERFSDLNAASLLKDADLVMDCSDNFSTRQSINRNCIKHQIPWVFAAVTDFEFQLSFFDAKDKQAPCFSCLFPEVDATQDRLCDTQGVLGTTPAVAGGVQANEALKYLLGLSGVLKGRLLVENLITYQSKVIKYRANTQCSHHSTGNNND